MGDGLKEGRFGAFQSFPSGSIVVDGSLSVREVQKDLSVVRHAWQRKSNRQNRVGIAMAEKPLMG